LRERLDRTSACASAPERDLPAWRVSLDVIEQPVVEEVPRTIAIHVKKPKKKMSLWWWLLAPFAIVFGKMIGDLYTSLLQSLH
jgi:hypothetical protein